MDKIDLKLISLLQQNARMPLKQLAEQVYLSSPATAARLERLEKEGIISGYRAEVNLKKLGFPVIAFINLELRPDQKPEFYPFICSHPNVLECSCVTGHFAMHIKVAFDSTENLDQFIGLIQKYGSTETQIVFSTPQEPRGVDIEELFKCKGAQ
ncbi:MAG: Lrp/AsnC family transcriptional regulator [Clostridia bacterium]|nr:Lrp/AsnC family transcriptional regulator [Oscillospiraceae bacterium]MBR6693498.1 Lrp/AsnC family transcriptional regulator [Clostridia bacterium]